MSKLLLIIASVCFCLLSCNDYVSDHKYKMEIERHRLFMDSLQKAYDSIDKDTQNILKEIKNKHTDSLTIKYNKHE